MNPRKNIHCFILLILVQLIAVSGQLSAISFPTQAASLGVSPGATASTYTVNTTTETDDDNPGDNICHDSANKCSLRAAVQEANAHAGADVITLPANTYQLTQQLDISDDLTINGGGRTTAIIDGAGPSGAYGFYIPGLVNFTLNDLTLTNFSKALKFTSGSVNAQVNINNSNLRDNANSANGGSAIDNPCPNCTVALSGSSVYNNSASVCGAIINMGSINFSNNSLLYSNQATAGNGGAICNDSGFLNLTMTLVYGNQAGNDSSDMGGAIYQYASDGGHAETTLFLSEMYSNSSGKGGGMYTEAGSLLVNSSKIFGNSATGNGGGAYIDARASINIESSLFYENSGADGGGLYLTTPDGSATWQTLTIRESTIISNTASGSGGGVYFDEGNIAVINSTLSGNRANVNGAGVYATNTAEVRFSNVTITHNIADFDDNGNGKGGGVYQALDSNLEFDNSVVAGNEDLTIPFETYAPDCFGTFHSEGYNLVGLANALCSLTGSMSGVQYSSFIPALDPRLGPLTFYSEYAYYHPVWMGPLVDRGSPNGCHHYTTLLDTDQIGQLRPYGSAIPGYTPRCDLGAVEASFKRYDLYLPITVKK